MASVLETFLILFEADADKAKKDIDGLDKTLGKTEKTADKSVKSVDNAADSFVAMGKSALTAAAGVFAFGSMIAGVTAKAAQLDELGKFSQLIGENIGDVDAWSEAVIRSGGSADSFRQSIKSLNEKVVDASVKGMNEVVPFFNQLGISIVSATGKARSSLDLMPELASAFERLSKQESAGLGQKLGLDQGTILLLQSGRREVDALIKRQKALGIATKESFEISAKFNDQMADLKQVLGFASQSMLVNVLPAITKIVGAFTDVSVWIRDNKVLVDGFFIGLGVAVLKFALPQMVALTAAIWAAISPFLLLGGAILALSSAFALAFEDVEAFRKGNDSLLGEMIKKWPKVGAAVDTVIDRFQMLKDLLKDIGEIISDLIFDPAETFENIGGFIKESIGNIFGSESDQDIKIRRLLETTTTFKGAAISPAGVRNSATGASNRNTSVQTGDIIINTQATDADGIAANAAGALSQQLNTAVDNFDDGLVA